MPIYTVNGKTYNIPEEKSEKFEGKFPDATVEYHNEGKTYQLPISKRKAFLAKYPNASYVSEAIGGAGQANVEPVMADSIHYAGRMNAEPTDMQQMADAQRAQWNEAQRRADERQATGDVPKYNFLRVERPELIDAPELNAPKIEPNQFDADRVVEESMQRINGAVANEYDAEEDARNRAMQRQAQANYEAQVKQNAEQAVGELRGRAAELSDKYKPSDERDKSIALFNPTTMGGVATRQGYFHGHTQDMLATNYILDRTEEMIGDYVARQNMGSWANLGRSMAQTAFDPKTWDFGLLDLTIASRLEAALDKADKGGKLTDTEQLLIDAAVNQQVLQAYYGELSGWQEAGKGFAESLPFMVQIATNPLSSIGKYASSKVAKKVLNYVTKKLSKRAIQAILTKAAGATTRVLGDVAGGYAVATTSNIMSTAADAVQRQTGDILVDYDADGVARYDGRHNIKEAGEAWMDAINNNAFEFVSESMGAYFAPFLKGLGKVAGKGLSRMGMGAVNRWVGDFAKKGSVKAVGEFFDKTQWHGFAGEYAEEIANGMLNAAFVGDMTMEDVFSRENLIDTAIGLSVMSVLGASVSTGAYIANKRAEKARLDQAAAMGQRQMRTAWKDFMGAVQRSENAEQLTKNLRDVMNLYNVKTLHGDDIRAILNYANAYNRYKALDAVSAKAVQDGVMDAEELELRDLYEGGRWATDKASVRQEYEVARDVLAGTMGMPTAMVERTFFDYGDALRIADSYEASGDTQTAEDLRAYVRAKAKHDGMTEIVRDRYNDEVRNVDAEVDAISNKKDGNIYTVTLQDGAQGYIVDGNIVYDEEGLVDNNNTDELLHINIDGAVKQITPERIAKIESVQPAGEAKMVRIDAIDASYKDAYDSMTGYSAPVDNAPVTEGVPLPADVASGNAVNPAEGAARALGISVEDLQQAVPDAQTGEATAAAMEAAGNMDGANAVRGYINEAFGVPAEETATAETTGGAPAEQGLLGRIPKDEQGNPLYEQVNSDTAWDAIVEQSEGNEAIAQAVADGMVADKKAALKKLEKSKAKAGVTVAEKITAEKERLAAIDAAKQELAIWQKIAGTANRRKMEVEAERRRVAEEAAAIRKAEEEKMRAEREEAERIEREALNGVPDMVDDTPQDARARGYRRVSGHKIDRQEPVQGLQGKEVSVKFSDDAIANGRVAVIEAEQLQPSHVQGVRNPLHFIDEAQPKERNDEASVLSARKIAGNIRPEEITSSVTAYTGAPTVNARGEAIQGNNRSDALRLMWESYQEQAAKYKQYLMDHAEEFGLNAEDIAGMQHPVLVNMLDVEDADAITLGQFVAQDTESGGVERIKPKNALQKMGNDMRSFANLLLKSNDEDTSFAGLVDNNGVEVLKWMSQRGYITPTQYRSAFDSKGNLTAEAKNDLRGIMYQSIFKGGSTRLEEMFNAMPAKAQKAILATAFRDYDSPNADRMIEEIQNSIRAFYALSQSEDFVNAKTFKDARLAVEGWKIQYQIDDVTGESYLPAENFTNFALLLATMYKGENQNIIQGTFNKLYDLIQGTQEENLFEQPDNTPRTLAQAIYETLNITYNGQQRSNVLVGDSSASQRGQQGSTGNAATGERIENGERTADSAGSIESSSRQSEIGGTPSLLDVVRTLYSKGKEVASKLFSMKFFDVAQTPKFMQKLGLRGDKFTIKYGVIARHLGKDGSHDLSERDWAQLPQALQNPFAISKLTDKTDSYRIYTTLQTESGEFVVVGADVKNAGREIEVNAVSTVFGRRNNANLPKNEEVIYRSKEITPEQSSLLERPNFAQYPTEQELSKGKGTINSPTANDLGKKNTEAEVNTKPTDKQKEAGNYKKGHVQNAAPKKKSRKSPITPQELAQEALAQAEENRRKPLRERAQEWQEKLGVQVNVIESVDEVKNSAALQAINEGARVAGWFSGGKVYVYMPGIEDMADLDKTVVHEVVAHKGLKSLMGDKFDALCDKVWESMGKEAREKFLRYVNAKDIDAPSVAEMRAAADEYMAYIAEGVDLTDADKTVWQKIVEFFREFIETLGVKMSDADIETLIKASYANLRSNAAKTKETETKQPKDSQPARIEDVGEVLAGARKDELKVIASSFENATEKSLVELPFSKAFKKPDLKKTVESGALREEDALFYEAMFNALVNSSKPKNSARHRNAVSTWAQETYKSLQLIKSFVEADEAARDRIMAEALADKFPAREEELAVIEQRKVWNAGNNAEWGDKTTPNPVWIMQEVLKALGYKPGDKVDIPFGVLKANVFATGYEFYNKKGDRLIMQSVPTVEEGIERIVWLSKIKRGDSDTMHPVSSFFATPTKRDMGDSGRYCVLWGTLLNPKRNEFDSIEEANAFAAGRKEAVVRPIQEVVKRYGYKIAFRNPLTGDKFHINDMEFETEGEAMQYLEENYDAVNEQTNELLAKERGESKKDVSADDLLEVAMVRGEGKWKYAVNIKGKYANNMGMPLLLREFDTREEARAFLNESKNEVFEVYKKQQAEQKKFVFFDTGENSRIGEDYRGDRDVAAQDFMDTFGFRGVQFGNWTNQADRQMAVNQAYDAFLDLAKLLGVSPKALSLNGELGMAFGSRGSGFGNAHYELGKVVINLTKTRGAGSLAHEWWHALDNYFARRANVPMGMVTDSRSIDMRPELRQAYNELLKMIENSDFYKRSKAKGDYWGRMHEVTARLMAEWVDQSLKDKGELNTFLSRGVNEEKYKRMNYDVHRALAGFPYPTREELKEFGDAMRNIFDTVEEQETENGNVMLFRKKVYTDEEQQIIDKAKADGTYMKAPNGKPTRLTTEQWVQVRTKAFKRWFGDWEAFFKKNFLLKGKPVAALTGDEFAPIEGKKLTEQVENYFASIGGKAVSPLFGDVILDRKGADDSLSHGMGRNKAIAYAAVKEVIENGVLVDTHTNHKGRGYNTAIIAAPIEINGERYVCMVVVRRNVNENRFYLHEVTAQKNLRNDAFVTNPAQKPASVGDIANVLQNIVSASDNVSKIVDENGEPMVVYHRTDNVFTKYDMGRLGEMTDINASDWAFAQTAHLGIWTNSGEQLPIGEWQKYKMPLFVNIKNPIQFNSLSSLVEEIDIVGDAEELRLNIQNEGYDGIILKDEEFGNVSQVSFFPNQIKSATENNGEFSTENDDIRFRRASSDIGDEYMAAVENGDRETAQRLEKEVAGRRIKARDRIKDITGAKGYGSNSAYIEGETEDGEKWVIRVADHPANMSNFEDKNEDAEYILSIVIDEEFDEKNAAKHHEKITNDENVWQVVVNPLNIDYDALTRGVERFKRTGEGQYVYGNVNDVMFRMGGSEHSIKKSELRREVHRVDADITSAVNDTAAELNTPVEIVSDIADVPDARRRSSKGWFSDGKVYVVLPNAEGVDDAVETVLHEVVGHKGLRRLFGEKFDDMLADVFKSAPKNVRAEIMRRALDLMRRGRENFLHEAVEEYLAEQAERGFNDYSMWDKVKALFHKVLRSVGIDTEMSDEEIRYMLWRSYRLMKSGKSLMNEVENINKQAEFGVGDYRMRVKFPLRSEGRPVLGAEGVVELRGVYEERIAGSMFQMREALQDSMRSLYDFQKYIEEATGKKLPDWMNAYYLENAMSSANKAEAELFGRVYYQPVIEAVNKLHAEGMEYNEIYDYMMAKHGIERNREMAVREVLTGRKGLDKAKYADWVAKKRAIWAQNLSWIDEQRELDALARTYGIKEKDYSGLMGMYGGEYRRKAYDAVLAVERAHKAQNDMWEAIRKATREILAKQYGSNMMSAEVKDEIEGMYRYYIPLRGFDEKTVEDVYEYMNSSRSPLARNVTAKGRKSKADNPVAWIALMAESAIVQGNRNRMKNAFFNLVMMNPNDLVSIDSNVYLEFRNGVWQVVTPDIPADATPDEVREVMRKFEEEMENKIAAAPDMFTSIKDSPDIPYVVTQARDMAEHQIFVRRNGKLFVMTVNGNPRLAQALNGYTNPDSEIKGAVSAVVDAGKVVNRWLSSVYTTRNPNFVLSNFIRDAAFSNTMEWVKENPKYAGKFNINFTVAAANMLRLVHKYDRGELDMGKPMEKLFYDFMVNGGETGYTNIKQIDARKKELQKKLKKNGRKNAVEFVEAYFDEINRAVENAARFAAFMTSRQMGRSVTRSIWDAKEVSVNFNKKGAGDRMFGAKGQTFLGNTAALIAGLGVANFTFWNAGVQGLNNFATAVDRNKGKGAALITALAALGMATAYFNDDDDEEEDSYWLLPSWIRRNNFVFRFPGMEDWVTLPLPVEYRAIHGMSNYLTGVAMGKEEFDAVEFAGLATQILPLDMLADGGGLNALVPTWAKPLWQNYTNTNWMGMPIAKENAFNELDPEYKRVYSNVSAATVEFSKMLHLLGGGDTQTRTESDLWEWNPAKLENLASGYLGGYAQIAGQLWKTAEWALGMREYDNSYIPLVNRVLRSSNVNNAIRGVKDEYYRNVDKVKRLEHSMNDWKRDMTDPAKSDEERANAQEKYRELMQGDYISSYYELKAIKKMADEFRDMYKVFNNEGFKNEELDAMKRYNRVFDNYWRLYNLK